MAGFIAAAITKTATKLSSLLSSVAIPASSSSTPSEASNTAFEDLKKLERTMKRIQAIMMDAHDRDISDHSQKLCLEELKQVAYDVEDVVGDYEYDVIHAKIQYRNRMLGLIGGRGQMRKRQEEVIDLDSISVIVPVSEEISGRVKDIRARFVEITEEWKTLRLTEYDAPRRTNCSTTLTRPPTSSLVGESTIYGRDEDKENIIKQLLSDDGIGSTNNDGTVKVVSIVGMGGIGKTTLAQLVYNDERVVKHFELKGWVCVSEDFNVVTLTKNIISSFTKRSCQQSEIDSLHQYLQEEVRGKRFLLVLDDVWNDDPILWHSLQVPLTSATSGTILITARSSGVAKIMQTKPHTLKNLKFHDCWSLFEQLVFDREDREVDENHIEIAEKIVHRCGGLPLAVKAIGGVLRCDYRIESWIHILESKELGSNARNGNFSPVLKLSYVRMPSYLKECFATFALFPRCYYLCEDSIIKLWMSMGLVHSASGKKAEEAGRVYINELLERSMIQVDTKSSGKQRGFVIHDLLHELAQQVVGEDFLVAKPKSWNADLQTIKKGDSSISAKVRYLSYLSLKDIEHLKNSQGSTTLRVILRAYHKEFICHMFEKVRYLRFLDLKYATISTLPESIGNLKQLRYLNLSESGINILPDSICSLYNLEILELTGCPLVELPKAIGQLRNLRHLNYSSQYLSYLPSGIGLLSNLETLSVFIVGNDDSKCSIAELKYLALLTELHIVRLGNVINTTNIGNRLLGKQSLQELTLDWTFDDSVHVKNVECQTLMRQSDEYVLRSLEPNPCLKQLTINKYAGSIFP